MLVKRTPVAGGEELLGNGFSGSPLQTRTWPVNYEKNRPDFTGRAFGGMCASVAYPVLNASWLIQWLCQNHLTTS